MQTTSNDQRNKSDSDRLILYKDLREARQKKISRRRRRTVAVIVAFILILLIYINWDNIIPTEASDSIQGFLTQSSVNHFPVTIPSGNLKNAAPFGSNLAVLTNTSFYLYSNSGSQLVRRQHSMDDPQICTAGSRALLYDRGGKQYRIEGRFDEPVSQNTSFSIITGTLGLSGNFALVTESDKYLSELSVFDSNGKSMFHWYDTQGRIISTALSPDGKSIAATEVSSKNGDITSSVKVFRLDSTKAIAEKQFDGALLFSIQYSNNNRIAAVGDIQTNFFDGDGKSTGQYTYGSKKLSCFANANGSTVLGFNRYVDGKAATSLVTLNEKDAPKSAKTADMDTKIESISTDSSGYTALASDKFYRYDANGKKIATVKAAGDKLASVTQAKNHYIFGLQEIYWYTE